MRNKHSYHPVCDYSPWRIFPEKTCSLQSLLHLCLWILEDECIQNNCVMVFFWPNWFFLYIYTCSCLKISFCVTLTYLRVTGNDEVLKWLSMETCRNRKCFSFWKKTDFPFRPDLWLQIKNSYIQCNRRTVGHWIYISKYAILMCYESSISGHEHSALSHIYSTE